LFFETTSDDKTKVKENMSVTKAYNVNTPKTDFPMKANSAVRELEIQKRWEEINVYMRSVEKRKNGEKFVLHDGPPYLSSAKIHIGTALNKILKDIVTRYKALRGYYAPYVPGYDSHGLPIETAVLKDVKGGRHALSPVELRKRCREFALNNLKGQEANFKRLGVWGDWANPYITLDKHFEAAQLRVFGKMAAAGYLYKGLKSVFWCTHCETALAEAEVEYADHKSHSIYVKFPVAESSASKLPKFAQGKPVSFVIWTTTPWTLPANLGIALHPEFDYSFVETKEHGVLIVATELVQDFLSKVELDPADVTTLGTVKGATLEYIEARHPYADRTSLVILGTHVTLDAGTGCVHTAPGHGPEDFEIGAKYKLGVLSPVNERGIYTEEALQFAGMHYEKAQEAILETLREKHALLHNSKYTHSYPHCWRCKNPIIFRATEQWFASVDGFRAKALKAIDEVQWLPNSGRNRIFNMVENRTDWCISRQRSWGVPIPVFYCDKCRNPIMTQQSIERVADIFDKEGSDSWWERDVSYFLEKGTKCEKCSATEFIQETDIMDVWFDSGTSHAGVLDTRPELKGSPCEMYLEGSDQHRGWFQSSLLTSVATKGRAPYKIVLTHGFVVDENGRKMSKSVGNFVDPETVIKEYGADVLRLWVASVNYTDDIPIGKNMLVQLADVYRKLRNTVRYLLGNLEDFDPEKDAVPFDQLKDLDRFILHRLSEVVDEVVADFDHYEFFKYYQVLQNFCVVDLSSFYFDIAKDRLYTSAPKSLSRRSVQTVLAELTKIIVHLLVPVTPHLAEDIWNYIPENVKKSWKAEESVLLSDLPKLPENYANKERSAFWTDMIKVRGVANKALEQARAAKKFGSSLEAQVDLVIEDAALRSKVESLGGELAGFFITSQATVNKNPSGEVLSEMSEEGITAKVRNASGKKCIRCWKYLDTVGTHQDHPELCTPCLEAISN
jgi:isoleucyl-tRNA synthetase